MTLSLLRYKMMTALSTIDSPQATVAVTSDEHLSLHPYHGETGGELHQKPSGKSSSLQ
jgi:hypothetical protein